MKDFLSGHSGDLLINLLASLIFFLVGLAAARVWEWFQLRAARRVWSLTRQEKRQVRVQVIAATLSEQVNKYDRHGTGMGEVQAYGAVQKSLQEAYGENLQLRFSFSRDFLRPIDVSVGKEPSHVIVLGSKKYNEVTKDFHDRYPDLPLSIDFQDGEPVAIADKRSGARYEPTFANGELTRDYGIVSRLPVTRGQGEGPTVFLIEGIRTYGVGAGGRLLLPRLVSQLQGLAKQAEKHAKKHPKKHYWQALFRVEVGSVDQTPILVGLVAVDQDGKETGRSGF